MARPRDTRCRALAGLQPTRRAIARGGRDATAVSGYRRTVEGVCDSAIKNILRQGLDLLLLPEEPARSWSKGSRFARKRSDFLFPNMEDSHDAH